MNGDDLKHELRKLSAPEASEEARARARHRALLAFQQAGSGQIEQSASKGFPGTWGYVMALALAIAILPFFFIHHHATSENLAGDRQILQQMEKLFPNQVDAVVEKNGKLDLSIAQAPVIGSDQPILLVFKRGLETIRVLSFSGHRVCLDLGPTHTCLDILENATGGVILEVGDKVWLTTEHPVVAGYVVHAQTLEASL